MLFQALAVVAGATCVSARSIPDKLAARQAPSATTDAPSAQATICGDIVEAVNDGMLNPVMEKVFVVEECFQTLVGRDGRRRAPSLGYTCSQLLATSGATSSIVRTNIRTGYDIFWASDAYNCLISVPFNAAVATRFIQYWNETFSFQSTLAYLKNPPEGYQQPAVDVLAELQRIQDQVNANSYANQYDFEADFQLLTYALHDSHVYLTSGVLSAFSFASPYEIVSVSIDGKQAPKVYITDDVLDSPKQGYTPSAITSINGTEVNQFLSQYAALNSWGYVEPHAEWNALMSNPTFDIQGGLTTFSGAGTFYPGDNLTYTFENGTSLDTVWLAIYNEVANYTGPLTTGGDFYNYFVLGLIPASFDPTTIIPPNYSDDVVDAPTSWNNASYGAFPEDPDIVQPDIGVFRGGLVTGYFYEDISTGVLSLPSFDAIPATIGNYSQAVSEFIGNASDQRLSRIVIDLQRNSGGAVLLAFTTFKNFFPDLLPFAGSRRRSFPTANAMGSAISNNWAALDGNNEEEQSLKHTLASDEWVITDRLNAATVGKNFTSWKEYQGPVSTNGDTFSLTEQYDLANEVFDTAAFDEWIPVMYLPNKTEWPIETRPFNPDQIVLLTDGLCASACALFVEMMTRVGVKTVVAGGRPNTGPMQAASGTRGAILYSAFDLDDDMSYARSIDNTTHALIPEVRDAGIYTKAAGFNLRDQIRKEDTTPLQFKYEAADCRIWYTRANVYNMTQLWRDVNTAAFVDTSKCVEGSRGFSTKDNTSPSPPPKPQAQKPILSLSAVDQVRFDEDPTDGMKDGDGRPIGTNDFTLCPSSGVCQDGRSVCRPVTIKCYGESPKPVYACLPPCTNRKGSTSCPGTCNILQTQETKVGLQRSAAFGEPLLSGLCYPGTGTRKLGCARNAPV